MRRGHTGSRERIPVPLPFIQQIVVELFQEMQYSRDKREELPASWNLPSIGGDS